MSRLPECRRRLKLLAEVGLPKISERILLLIATLKDKLAPVDFEFLSPNEESSRSSFLTFRSRRVAAEKLANALAENDVIVSLRVDRADRSWLRVSPHFYNTLRGDGTGGGVIESGRMMAAFGQWRGHASCGAAPGWTIGGRSRQAEHRPVAGAPSGDSPRCSSISGVNSSGRTDWKVCVP